MSIFKFFTISSLNFDLNDLEEVKRLAYLIRAPKEVQEVILGFGQSKLVSIKKTDRLKQGLEHPIIKWMNENAVTIENDYEMEGWPLLVSFKEEVETIKLKRNENLVEFYEEWMKLASSRENFLIHLEHVYSSKLYAYWLVMNQPSEFAMVLSELNDLFDLNPTNYYSYTLIEKKILERVQRKFAEKGIKLSYEKDNPKYAKSLTLKIGTK